MVLRTRWLPKYSQDVNGSLTQSDFVALLHPVPALLARDDQAQWLSVGLATQIIDGEMPLTEVDSHQWEVVLQFILLFLVLSLKECQLVVEFIPEQRTRGLNDHFLMSSVVDL